MTGYINHKTKLDENCQKAYILISGQRIEHIHSGLQSHEYYQSMRGKYNVFLLMDAIKGMACKFGWNIHPAHALHDANRDLYHYYQTGHNINPHYLDTFKNKVSIIESYGRAIGTDPGLAKG